MANEDSPFGLRPAFHKNGSPYNGAGVKMFAADGSNALYVGDIVKRTGSGDVNGVPAVSRAGVTGVVYGVIVGILGDADDDLTRDTPRFVAAGDDAYLLVVTDPELLFTVQEDSVGGALAVTDIGQNINVIYGTPSTSHPIISALEIDSSSAAGTSTFPFSLFGVYQTEDNEVGTNARWLVSINNFDNAGV